MAIEHETGIDTCYRCEVCKSWRIDSVLQGSYGTDYPFCLDCDAIRSYEVSEYEVTYSYDYDNETGEASNHKTLSRRLIRKHVSDFGSVFTGREFS